MCAVRVALISSIIAASVVLLPLPGRAGHEHQPAFLRGNPLQHRGRAKLVDSRHTHRDDAEDHADRAALLERVAAGTGRGPPRCTRGRPRGSPLNFSRWPWEHRGRDRHHVVVVEALVLVAGSASADPHHGMLPGLQMQVGRATLDSNFSEDR